MRPRLSFFPRCNISLANEHIARLISGALRNHSVAIVDAAALTRGHHEATSDAFHFDGGVHRSRHAGPNATALREQRVSLELADALLRQLARLARRDAESNR